MSLLNCLVRNCRGWSWLIVACTLCATAPHADMALKPSMLLSNNPYWVGTFVDKAGRSVDKFVVPGKPPAVKAPAVVVPAPKVMNGKMSINVINNVPAFTWTYGCSATSAGMVMGYYDNTGCPNMYTGPANGGVCPMTNQTTWGSTVYPGATCGECPMVASHQGIDGRAIRGHVDDFWIDYDSAANDPFVTGGWGAHTNDCIGDFMGTNIKTNGNSDGSTTFYNYTDGSPLYDYTGAEPGVRDGCHGIKLFVESRGYSIQANGNFSQYIYGYDGHVLGFTFAQFQSEIDAGRPVLIQVEGHTMVGFGYNTSTSQIYIHDTWDNANHLMTWGGSYSSMQHFGVTVVRLAGLPFVNIASTNMCANAGDPLRLVGTNNLQVVGTMWISNAYNSSVTNFPAALSWTSAPITLAEGASNTIWVFGTNTFGATASDTVVVFGLPEPAVACVLCALVLLGRRSCTAG